MKEEFASPGGSVIPGTQWRSTMGQAQREDLLETKIGIIRFWSIDHKRD
jgi:hypothetical protein